MTTTTTKLETRVCRLCDEEKTLDLFERDKRVTGGITNRCKACKAGLNDRSRTLYSGLKYRAERDGQALEVTLKEIQALFAAFDGTCIYCGISEEESGRTHHIDHVIPTSEGGRHHRSNLVLSCASCNLSKGNEPFLSFYLRKKEEIGEDNFNTLIYYIAFMSEQPIDEVITNFVLDYKKKIYEHLEGILTDEELREVIQEQVKKKIISEAS